MGQKLPVEGVAWYIEQMLPALFQDRRFAGGCEVNVERDEKGWTLRVDLPQVA
ncbi:hypothetical protein JRC04_04750 [Mycolicibacterium sp. S2-37]|uniref:hypothetical protein n=1 Tax=Mycolicibacterium sp. S2-37 TaxID=2810297 RepID=UPI001A93F19F|nr:hypothetical protein [Mycolicibacterium sp. S2-37]MBO0676768.1 hypothetical protein [Mycolicibacterium sp. S2-37]